MIYATRKCGLELDVAASLANAFFVRSIIYLLEEDGMIAGYYAFTGETRQMASEWLESIPTDWPGWELQRFRFTIPAVDSRTP